MRIFALDRHPSSRNGGQEWSLLEECTGLSKRAHQVTLGYTCEGDLLALHRNAGVRTIRLPGVELEPRRRLRSAIDVARSVVKSMGNIDLVAVNQYHDALFGRLVAAASGVPLVCHLRLAPPSESCAQWRAGLRGVTRFIAASRSVGEAWSRLPEAQRAPIDVVYDGVDTDRFRPAADRGALRRKFGVSVDTFVVVYAGRIDRMKNLELVLRAFAQLGLRGETGRLWIAGRPVDHPSPEEGQRYVESLKALATELTIGDQVSWLGPRADVPDLLAAADAAVLFSDSEAFGRATVEALACGIPIVAHRPGGTSEILTGEFERFAFDMDHPEKPVEIIRSCIGLRDRDPDFAVRARAHAVANFSSAAMVTGIERSFERALRTPG